MTHRRQKVLLISKPISPPWNDSSKNLVRDLLANSVDTDYHFFSHDRFQSPWEFAEREPIYPDPGDFSPGLLTKGRVFLRLMLPDSLDLYHFFFAPNRISSYMARMALRIKKRISVHTILSSPADDDDIRDLLFADHTVVLSHHYEKKLRDQGLDAISVIPPGIPIERPIEDNAKPKIREKFQFDSRPIVLFAGDYQFSNAAWTILEAIPDVIRETKAQFVYACRIKQPKSREIESAIRHRAMQYGLADDVRFYNELDNIRELIAVSDISIMPADSLYAKMDIPLVLLECLSERVPIIIADIDPLREILQDDYGILVQPSHPEELSRAIIEMLRDPQKRRRMGEIGRSHVEHAFDVRVMARRYEKLYSDLSRKR